VGYAPVRGNFDGDGKEDVAAFHDASGLWFIQKSSGGTLTIGFGSSGYTPMPGDYNGDGITNLDECNDGPTHPKGFFTRYLAEGAANSFFDLRLAIFNPNNTKAVVLLQFQQPGGGVFTHILPLGPRQRLTLRPVTLAGFNFSEFSTTIESDVEVVVDRLMTWNLESRFGSHAETAVPARSTTWYLAEGSTAGPFSLFYLLQNPNSTTANVTINYLLPGGQAPVEGAAELLLGFGIPGRIRHGQSPLRAAGCARDGRRCRPGPRARRGGRSR